MNQPRVVLAIGGKYITTGNAINPPNEATITCLAPFTYYWKNDGQKGCWSAEEFGKHVRSGYLVKVVSVPSPVKTSLEVLKACIDVQAERGKSRDAADGERSMRRTVEMFNACFGTTLTETMGWQFMVCLKMARSVHGDFNMDDYIDGTSYFSLAGESAAKEA